MLTQEQFVCTQRAVPLGEAESPIRDFNRAVLKVAAILAIGIVGVAAPFIIHAAVTKKPGTVWERDRRRAI